MSISNNIHKGKTVIGNFKIAVVDEFKNEFIYNIKYIKKTILNLFNKNHQHS